jgi:hypothetical protein
LKPLEEAARSLVVSEKRDDQGFSAYRLEMKITSAAPINEMAQSMIVFRFPHRWMPILSKPGTGGIKRRTATSATTKAIVKSNAMRP